MNALEAFKEWYDAVYIGDGELNQKIPAPADKDYSDYMNGYTLAHGAFLAGVKFAVGRQELAKVKNDTAKEIADQRNKNSKIKVLIEDRLALQQWIADFFSKCDETRLPEHNASSMDLLKCNNRAGFRYDANNGIIEYWVHPKVFKNEICLGSNPVRMAKMLTNDGLIRVGDMENRGGKTMYRHTKKKLVRALGKTMNFYVFVAYKA